MSKLNLSAIFKSAHKLAKQVIKSGDSYSVTFGACLKVIYADIKNNTVIIPILPVWFKLDDRKREEIFILPNGKKLNISNDKKTKTYFVNMAGKKTLVTSKKGAQKVLDLLVNTKK